MTPQHERYWTLLQSVAERIITQLPAVRGATRAEVVAATDGSHGRGVDIVVHRGRASAGASRSRPTRTSGPTRARSATAAWRSTAPTQGCLALRGGRQQRDARARLDARLGGRGPLLLLSRARPDRRTRCARCSREPDEVFFSEIAVERDELLILPMDQRARVVRGAPSGLHAAPGHARRRRVVVPSRASRGRREGARARSEFGRDLPAADSARGSRLETRRPCGRRCARRASDTPGTVVGVDTHQRA